MRRWVAVAGTVMAFTLMLSNLTVSAAAQFASPAFAVAWQRGEAGYPNFWGPLALAHDGQAEPYVEGNLNGQSGQRLVQYFDKARMEMTNTAVNPPVVTSGLLATELITGKRQLGDNTFEQHNPANINIAGDPGSDSLTYAALSKVAVKDTQRPVADLKPPIAYLNGQFQVVPNLPVAGLPGTPSLLYGPYISDPNGVYGQYVLKQFAEFINAFPQGQGLTTIGYPLSPVVATQVNIKGSPTWVLVQAFQRRVLTLNVLNPPGSQVEFGNIGQHYYTWRYASNA